MGNDVLEKGPACPKCGGKGIVEIICNKCNGGGGTIIAVHNRTFNSNGAIIVPNLGHVLSYIKMRIETLSKDNPMMPLDVRAESRKLREARTIELQMLQRILEDGDITQEGPAVYKLKNGFVTIPKDAAEEPNGFDSRRKKPAPTREDLIRELGHDCYEGPTEELVANRPKVGGK